MINHVRNVLCLFFGVALFSPITYGMETPWQQIARTSGFNPLLMLPPAPKPPKETFWQSMLKTAAQTAQTAVLDAVATKIASTVTQPIVNGISDRLQNDTCNHLACCGSWISSRWLRFKLDHPVLSNFLPKVGMLACATAGLASTRHVESAAYKKSALIAFPIIMAWKTYSLYRLGKRLHNSTFFIPEQDHTQPTTASYCDYQSWPLSLCSFKIACAEMETLNQTIREHPSLLIYGSSTPEEKLDVMRRIAQDMPLFIIDSERLSTMPNDYIANAIRLTIQKAHDTMNYEGKPCATVCINNIAKLFSLSCASAIRKILANEIEQSRVWSTDRQRVIMVALDNNRSISQTSIGELFYMHVQFNRQFPEVSASDAQPTYTFITENDSFLNALGDRSRTLINAGKQTAQPQMSKEEALLLAPPPAFPKLEDLPCVPTYLSNMVKKLHNPASTEESTPRNILLWGKPGTGKSLMAVAFAKSTQLPAYILNATELADSKRDLDPSVIFDLLGSRATRLDRPGIKRAILVLDECDILFKPQEELAADSHAQRVSSQLRSLLSGLHAQSKNIMIIATCNGNPATDLDKTLTRDERFHTINITQPHAQEDTKRILAYDLQHISELSSTERDEIAARLSEPAQGLSQAQLKDLLNSARFEIDMDNAETRVEEFIKEATRLAAEKKRDASEFAESESA